MFNVGVGNARKALGLANGGEHAKVVDEMSQYVNGTVKDKKGKAHKMKLNGLVRRREREVKAFHDDPPAAQPAVQVAPLG